MFNFETHQREMESLLIVSSSASEQLSTLKVEVERGGNFLSTLEEGLLEDPEKMKNLMQLLFYFYQDHLGLISQEINEKNVPAKHSRDFKIPWGSQEEVKRAIIKSIQIIVEKLTGKVIKISKSLYDPLIKITKELFNEKGASLDASHSKTTGLREAFLEYFPVFSDEEIKQRERAKEEEKRAAEENRKQVELEKKQIERAKARAEADALENSLEANETFENHEEELYKNFMTQQLINWEGKKAEAETKIEEANRKLAHLKNNSLRGNRIQKKKEGWEKTLETAQEQIDYLKGIPKSQNKDQKVELKMEEENIVNSAVLKTEDVKDREVNQLVTVAVEEMDPVKKEMYSFLMFPDSKFNQVPFSQPAPGEILSPEELKYRYDVLKKMYGEGAKVLSRKMVTGVCEEGIDLLKTYDPKDKKLADIGGFSDSYPRVKRKLRKGAYDGLLLAQQFAKLFGLELLVESAFRSIKYQEFLKERADARSEELGIESDGARVAKGGDSDHNEAAGVDIVAYLSSGIKCTSGPNDSSTLKREKIYSDILILCMNLAGWTWYTGEDWHFSYGTKDSNYVLKKMGIVEPGKVKQRAYGLVE